MIESSSAQAGRKVAYPWDYRRIFTALTSCLSLNFHIRKRSVRDIFPSSSRTETLRPRTRSCITNRCPLTRFAGTLLASSSKMCLYEPLKVPLALKAENTWPEQLVNSLTDQYWRGDICASYIWFMKVALDSETSLIPNLYPSKIINKCYLASLLFSTRDCSCPWGRLFTLLPGQSWKYKALLYFAACQGVIPFSI